MSVDEESEPADAPPPPLEEATALAATDDGYNVELSPAYRTAVGPFGGYLATIALRAAASATDRPRPASLSCHFLNVADPGAARVRVSLRHETRRAASVAVDLHQGGRPILSAVAWFVTDATGIDHDPPQVPHVPPVALTTPFDEVHKGAGFWFLESRPIYQPSLTQPPPPGTGAVVV